MSPFAGRTAAASVKRWAVPCLLLVSTLAASAQTVLIGPGIRNGDFEAGTGTGNRTYTQAPPWVNIGTGGQTQPAAVTSDVYAGARALSVLEGTLRVAAQDTGYDIAAGDLFGISYFWRDQLDWNDPSDQIAIRLFSTTDNTTNGIATTFATLLSGISTNNNSYQAASGIATAAASEAGKRLFVAIGAQDGNSSTNGYARLDDFVLTVSPVVALKRVVDYDPAVRNGGFESSNTVWGTGLNVTNSYTIEFGTNAIEGVRALSINNSGGQGGLQNTGYTIGNHDVISFVFDWTGAYLWQTTDAISWRLLTTSDDTVAGTVSVIAAGSVSGKSDVTNWSTVQAVQAVSVQEANRGRQLWVEIYGNSSAAPVRYARVDKVRLIVNQYEPPGGTVLIIR